MKNGFFLRVFGGILGCTLVSVLVFSCLMVTVLSWQRQVSYEHEVQQQAEDVATYLTEMNQILSLRENRSLKRMLENKLGAILNEYQAEVWLVNAAGVGLTTGSEASKDDLNDPRVVEQIKRVLSGEEIRAQNLPGSSTAGTVTIGVPWYGVPGVRVLGAILLSVGGEALKVDYSDLIRYSVLAGLAALALSGVLVFIIARAQSRPIRQITDAVQAFAGGDFSRRVEGVKGDGDVARLADSFNAMAEDVSRLDQSRRSFVANVSHELRSPMTCIQGYVQGMLDGTIQAAGAPREVLNSDAFRKAFHLGQEWRV